MKETLKQFLQSLSFIEMKHIKDHAKGLLLALEKSNRKEMLDYEIKKPEKWIPKEVTATDITNMKLGLKPDKLPE